jgi:glycosyltransferase involved in cell wall biosynthesis
MAQRDLLVSILINNYNYGRFLSEAIDSALNQTYRNIEVVVVDDGSVDESREIIGSYGNRIISVLKENGGQASAFNEGIATCRGEIICMLDADDFFHPYKVERVVPYSHPGSLLYHRLQVQPGSEVIPGEIAPRTDYYRHAQRYRFVRFVGSPTSGLVIRRDLALGLIPLPTEHTRFSADDFLVRGAALVGEIIGIPDVLATYRVHGENAWYGKQAPKSRRFMNEMEKYLNAKLVEAGKRPVIDFYRSMSAIESVPQNAAELTRLAVSVFSHHPDRATSKFLLTTLARAYQCRKAASSSECTTEN